MKIRVLLADDHTLFRQGLRQLLEMEPDIEVVAEASDGLDVQTKARQYSPDVILMDINMPVTDGVAATKRIMEENSHVGIIVLTMYRQDQHVFEALRAGARGYLLKDALAEDVVKAIRTVYQGDSLIDPSVSTKLIKEFRRLSDRVEPEGELSDLTQREIEILRLVAAGLSNKEIGARLFLAEKTVKNYLTLIFQKLQIGDRVQAAVFAIQQGLIENPRQSSKELP
ncbi:MAG: response regulator transcription factor [Chloroflexi bacterium]|nr:response regulator transcription factor [Chloroflexota bacterium]